MKTRRKFLRKGLIILLTLSLVFLATMGGAVSQAEEIHLGILLSLTGETWRSLAHLF